MSPILGIYASSMTGHLYSSSYESIATATVTSGGQASITFSSIPQTYTHLQIRSLSRDTGTGSPNVAITFNGDGANNYIYYHQITGDGATASAGNGGASLVGNTILYYIPNANALASSFADGITDILDYTNTSKNKVHRSLSGFDVNGSGGYVTFRSGAWVSTAAINSITLTTAASFAQYSSFALYGIK